MNTVKCAHDGCHALVLATRGYCGGHGGPARLRKETRSASISPSAKTAPSLKMKKREQKRTQSWGTNGAPVGSGLSRFRGDGLYNGFTEEQLREASKFMRICHQAGLDPITLAPYRP